MSDDFIVDVRQIMNYPLKEAADPGDAILMQVGGLGGPYVYTTAAGVLQALGVPSGQLAVGVAMPPDAVGTGLIASSLAVPLGGDIGWNFYTNSSGALAYYGNGAAGEWCFDGTLMMMNVAPPGNAGAPVTGITTPFSISTGGYVDVGDQVLLNRDPTAGLEAATKQYVDNAAASITTNSVLSFNSRIGAVTLISSDITSAGGALLGSPAFTGNPTAPTQSPGDADTSIATTAFVAAAVGALSAATVASFNGRTGAVALTLSDIVGAGGAPNASPLFTGDPRAPTPIAGDNDQSIATTAFVTQAVNQSRIDSVLSFNGRTGAVVLTPGDLSGAGVAPLDSPVFIGTPTAPTASPGTNTGQLATTAFVTNAITNSTVGVSSFNTRTGAVTLNAADITAAGGAVLASPTFTGDPKAPTAAPGDADTSIATTAFVAAAVLASVVSFNTRTGAVTLTSADITGAGGALLASPHFTGDPQAPTAPPGDNDNSIASTAFVTAAITTDRNNSVLSFNSRTGAVLLTTADLVGAGAAPLDSPAFTGVPTAPTATAGTSSTQLATTAFVANAITASAAGVSSFNTRTGAVTLTSGDVTGVGGALLASPTFTGTPAAPTATAGTNTTQLATTAFVQAAITASAAGVSSFNTRTGAVTLSTADVTGAGGAAIASPSFTGTPAAPTATAGTNTTQLATCAFVTAAIATDRTTLVTSFNTRQGAVVPAANDYSFSQISGSVAASQMPAYTGAVTSPAGSTVNTLAAGAVGFSNIAAAALATTAQYRNNTANLVLQTDQTWGAAGMVALTDATTIAVDMSTFINATVTLAGNRTLGNPTNTKPGQAGVIVITQDATGTRTLAYGSNWKFAGGTAPVLSTAAGAVDDLYYFVVDSTHIHAVLANGIA